MSKLELLLERDHCSQCEQNTCDISIAYRLGYVHWAAHLFIGTGAASPEFEKLYNSRNKKVFDKEAELERKLLIKESHMKCKKCKSIIWLPEECYGFCDNCGHENIK